ncbi:MAG: sodium-dependent transporter [Gammaproteobacteria bacterium]|nr:sodium-dependent transporter [Gammaproteobacteria bacterium]MCW8988580.1 sodium-dependent transporter [Gammaproteobacteria bacterium]MCW9031880.1 sodium-dependent transporter [Gammaproteobacteria bacterium]
MKHEWSSRLTFILAAVGSAVGLGNIWKFPYITGEYGGGVFIFAYLICICLIGLPIMLSEIALGRRGKQSPVNTMLQLSQEAGAPTAWSLLGWSGMAAGCLILSYYSVIAGEVMAYSFRASSGIFNHQTVDGVKGILTSLESEPEKLLAWHTLFMALTILSVARGVKGGIEKTVSFLMPALFVLLLLLVGFAMNSGGFEQAIDFMFTPDIDKFFYARNEMGEYLMDAENEKIFTWVPMMVAMGHAFFTLSLGMGAIMMYGSYLNRHVSIGQMTLIIVVLDTVVALLAGLAIFPLVFANGLNPAAGPGLIFETLPLAFGSMAGGTFIGTLFFVLLFFAALSSAISLIEPTVAWLIESKGIRRIKATVMTGVAVWFIGLATIFSMKGVTFGDIIIDVVGDVELEAGIFKYNLFQVIDFFTASIMLPLGGFFIAIFAGWIMHRDSTEREFSFQNRYVYPAWYIMVRYVSPFLVFMVFLNIIGIFNF